VDDHQYGYITKLKNKNPDQLIAPIHASSTLACTSNTYFLLLAGIYDDASLFVNSLHPLFLQLWPAAWAPIQWSVRWVKFPFNSFGVCVVSTKYKCFSRHLASSVHVQVDMNANRANKAQIQHRPLCIVPFSCVCCQGCRSSTMM
jgi:hypothetical protein